METTKTTRIMSKWRVSSNGWGEDKTYHVYRRIDVNATDHSGNRENRGGVFDSKAEAQAYADKLNAGIDPEAEEEAETETIEDTGAPLEPYSSLFGGDLAKHAEHDVADATAGTALSTITLLCDGDARRDTVHNAVNDWITIDCAEARYKEAFRQETA